MLLDHVNILQGTASTHDLSYGNTLPLVARPWGMTHWTLQTSEGKWLFHPDQPRLQGLRATHQPSPWIGDYGAVTFLPQTGPLRTGASERSSSYTASNLGPDGIHGLRLNAYDTTLSLIPTERGAVMEIHFPGAAEQRLLIRPASGLSWAQVLPDRRQVIGYTRGNSAGVPDNFAHYYVVQFDEPFHAARTINGGQGDGESETAGAVVEFSFRASRVIARIAFSFISIDQARTNLERELTGSVERIGQDAQAAWEQVLGRIRIDATEHRRTFYSCLYRTALFPRMMHEFDAAGAMVHYSPYDGRVHPGPMYTDNGFWDTYRTLYPLLALIDRPRYAEMMAGFLNAYTEGGWLPQWCSPGYRNCMIGTHSDAVFAHAAACGVPMDVKRAYEACRKNADVVGEGGVGRAALAEYLRLGYVPVDGYHATSATLDFAYDDWCVAQLAKAAGDHASADRYLARSRNYRHLFEPGTGFFRAKDAGGRFVEPFDEFEWGGPYVEGGPWQHAFNVPHDPAGLIALHGGPQRFVAKLEAMFATPPTFRIGDYPHEIHEMTEMALAGGYGAFGQYAQSNQPVHQYLPLFTAAGRRDLCEHWTRRVMSELYNDGVKGFPGDEDNGEMAAWYVLNAIGLFPQCPGDGRYWFGTPLGNIELHPNGGRKVEIVAGTNQRKGDWITHAALVESGQLHV